MLSLTSILAVGIFMQCQSGQSVPPKVDCTPLSLKGTLQLNSPQFATLCRITGKIANVSEFTAPFVGFTADEVCDLDCRCVMGATARGGKCGTRSDKTVYCKCDYGTTPIPSISTLGCDNVALPAFIKTVCSNESPTANLTYPIFSDGACNSDCQCSHGYSNTGNHKCSTNNGQAGNTRSYCVCENATNIA